MIIAITGKKHSGKSTVADMLSNELGWEVTSFAKKLKEVTCALSGCTMEQLEDYDFKENVLVPTYLWPFCDGDKKPTYRNFLQYFGTNVMRKYYDNLWIDATLQNASDDVIISDCRFVNEANFVTSLNGVIIRVVRGDTSSEDSHSSEVEMDGIVPDVVIVNNGNLDDLKEKVRLLSFDIAGCMVEEVY